MLDLVSAAQLPGDELGVVDQLHLAGSQRPGALDSTQHSAVFGHVVRRDADPLGDFVEHLALLIGHHDANRRWPGVPPRTAIDMNDQLQLGGG